MLPRTSVGARYGLCAGLLASLHCSAPGEAERVATSSAAIVDGTVVTDPATPALYLTSPEGSCTATLIAPNLVVTARHCVAATTDGMFTCTPQGDLMSVVNGGGQLGSDDPANEIGVFTNAQVMAGVAFSAAPVAVGIQVISTGNLTVCRDDLAFVVLNQPVSGITPAAIRLGATSVGEIASAWGYGLTSVVGDPLALRVRQNADVVGVGPDSPTSTPQLAPVRAIRLGPDDITCNGDSGGPITAASTGAVIAVASLGNEANFSTPTCQNSDSPDTTGPRLAEYRLLTLQAFDAAGATPILEPGEDLDASTSLEAGSISPEGATTESLAPYTATGGACSLRPSSERRWSLGAWATTFALAAIAAGRRRR